MIRPRINVIWESICEKENIQKPSSEAFQNHLVRNLILIDISHLICLNGPLFFAPPWSVPPSTSGGSLFSLSLSPYSQSSLVQPFKPALDPIFSFCPPHLHLYNTQVPLGCSFGLGTLGRKFQGPGHQIGSRMGCHGLSVLTFLWACGFLCSAGHGQRRLVRAFHSRALLSGEGQAALESASKTLPEWDLLLSSPLLPSHSKSPTIGP